MENTLKKLDNIIEKYVTTLTNQPIKTAIKTAIVIWIIVKLKNLLK